MRRLPVQDDEPDQQAQQDHDHAGKVESEVVFAEEDKPIDNDPTTQETAQDNRYENKDDGDSETKMAKTMLSAMQTRVSIMQMEMRIGAIETRMNSIEARMRLLETMMRALS